MRHLFLFVAMFLFAAGANAQCAKASEGKACCKAKSTASASTNANGTKVASAYMEADEVMAASNGTITKRTCEVSGNVSYFEKSVCEHSGSVSWNEVQFDANQKKFTRVASASMEKDANGKEVKSCNKEAKACSGSKSSGKACCAAKKGA